MATESGATPVTSAKAWLERVSSRRRVMEKDWYKEVRDTLKIYESEDTASAPFNILFSNTETLLPALFNSIPRPDISRRFGMDAGTPAAALNHAAAEVSTRFLEYQADTNDGEYDTFGEVTTAATFSALLTGFGTARVHAKQDAKGAAQEICFEQVGWDRFVWGYARTWKQVPWVAYGIDMSKADFEATFPKIVVTDWYRSYTWPSVTPSEPDESKVASEEMKSPTMLVWEIWDAVGQQVVFVCDGPEAPLDQSAYPFNLRSRFPSPEPIRLIKRLLNLTPIVPYRLYKEQAQQLQKMVRRYNAVTNAIKVRGVYNSGIGELDQVLSDDAENKLIPSQSAAAFLDKGIAGNIWLMPLEELITVSTQMAQAIEMQKGIIYEIMGIADVMRGASQASETLGAQEIKNQWGTLRMKRSQRDIQVFARDLFRIALEYGAQLLAPAQMKNLTGVMYPLQMEQEQALQGKAAMEQAQAAGQQVPPPTAEQVARATLPTMEAIMGLLQDNFSRQYRIDIETNSTIDLEATEDQKNVGDFMNAFGQMMAGLAPLVEAGTMTFDVAKVMMIEVTRRFKFGRQVEDALETMQAPQGGGEQAGKAAADAFKQQLDMAKKGFELQQQQSDLEAQGKVLGLQKQLVMVTGQLEKALLDLEAQKLEAAKTAIDVAAGGAVKDLAMEGERQQHQGALQAEKQNSANALHAERQNSSQALHAERVGRAGDKVLAANKAHGEAVDRKNSDAATAQAHSQQTHKLEVKNLQKPAARPKV